MRLLSTSGGPKQVNHAGHILLTFQFACLIWVGSPENLEAPVVYLPPALNYAQRLFKQPDIRLQLSQTNPLRKLV